jgi:hypothetical protein
MASANPPAVPTGYKQSGIGREFWLA